jgi:hypothetical protein
MSLNYKNPISSTQLDGSNSVSRTSVFGTNFSVLQTGGYMEVYTLNDLYYTIPVGSTGIIEYSGNTIPIQFNISPTPQTVPNILTLNSDNISSGRQRLGMLVYVYENNLTYQLRIRDYDNLWQSANTTGDIFETQFGTSVSQLGTGGYQLVNAWTATTIEGVDGYTKDNAKWIIYQGDGGGSTVTGGTTSAGTSGTTAITMTLSANNQTSGVTIDMSPAFTFENTDSVKRTVGGITDGSSPFTSGKTIHEIIQEIFYPADKPTITYNTVTSLTINSPFSNNGLFEINQIGNFDLTSVVTRGQSIASPQTTKLMGLPNYYTFIPPQGYDEIDILTNSLNVTSDDINGYIVSQGYNEFEVSVDYDSGDIPVYDTGEEYPVPAFTNAGTITKTARFEGVYPLFANTISITINTKQTLVSMIESDIVEIDFTVGENNSGRQYFEIPNAWITGRPIVRIEQYSTVTQWTTDSYWSTSQVTNTIQGESVAYTKYTYNAQISVGKRLIRLVF